MQDDFIKRTYFVSPEYRARTEFLDAQETDAGTRFRGKQHHDNADVFPTWFYRSVFQPETSLGGVHQGMFMGENRVLCQLSWDRRYKGQHNLIGLDGPYNVVVEVKSQPASRELPRELTDFLTGNGYEEKKKESRLVKDLVRSLEI